MAEIQVIAGEIFQDYRGTITSMNDFRFEGVERFYFIKQADASIVRGWHAHQFEKKWFYCVKGSFNLAFVKIDDWDNPSTDLIPERFTLSDQKSETICLPKGYANCIKANEPDSILMVFSGKILSEALLDSWRYDKSMWGGEQL